MRLQTRLPARASAIAAYGVIILLIYSWTITWFFWKLNSWRYYLTAGEILTVLAYALAVNLVESLIVLAAVTALAAALPRRWFLDEFAIRATALVVPLLLFLMYAATQFTSREQFRQAHLTRLSVPVGVLTAFLVLGAGRIATLRRLLGGLADRATIFVYLLVPPSVVALVVVLVRNLG